MGRPQDEDPPPARRDPRPPAPGGPAVMPRPAGRSRTFRSWTRVPLRDSRSPLFGAAPPPGARLAGPCAPREVLVIHAVVDQLRL